MCVHLQAHELFLQLVTHVLPCLSVSVIVSARIFSSFKYVELLEIDRKVTFTNSFHRRVEEPSWQVSGSGWTRGVEDI